MSTSEKLARARAMHTTGINPVIKNPDDVTDRDKTILVERLTREIGIVLHYRIHFEDFDGASLKLKCETVKDAISKMEEVFRDMNPSDEFLTGGASILEDMRLPL